MTSDETLPITYENMVVPHTIVTHATTRSRSLVGTRSPYPTCDAENREVYHDSIVVRRSRSLGGEGAASSREENEHSSHLSLNGPPLEMYTPYMSR